jgi:hypothetical protein
MIGFELICYDSLIDFTVDTLLLEDMMRRGSGSQQIACVFYKILVALRLPCVSPSGEIVLAGSCRCIPRLPQRQFFSKSLRTPILQYYQKHCISSPFIYLAFIIFDHASGVPPGAPAPPRPGQATLIFTPAARSWAAPSARPPQIPVSGMFVSEIVPSARMQYQYGCYFYSSSQSRERACATRTGAAERESLLPVQNRHGGPKLPAFHACGQR